MKKVWKHSETGAFRFTEPPAADKDSWEHVEVASLSPKDRVFLRVDQMTAAETEARAALERFYDEKFAGMQREVDRLTAVLGNRGTPKAEARPSISIQRLFRAISTGDWTGADAERDAVHSDEAKRLRTLAATTDTAGGFMVPVNYLGAEFIQLLRANSVAYQAGARRLGGLMGSPVSIPKLTGGCTAYWVGENATITASDETVGQVQLQPRKLAALVQISNELLALADPSAEAMVQEDMARTLALKLDLGILKGSGASGQPLGILNTSGVNSTTATTAITDALVWDMVYELEADNADTSRLAIIGHPREWNKLRKAADNAGTPKFYAGAGAPITPEVHGFPFYRTTQLTAGELVVGNFNDCIVGEWAGLNFRASQDAGTAFANDQTWIRATMLVDVAVRNAVSFCVDTTFA